MGFQLTMELLKTYSMIIYLVPKYIIRTDRFSSWYIPYTELLACVVRAIKVWKAK